MKRSYAEALRSSSALGDVDETRLARAAELLQEATRDRIAENALKKAKREAKWIKAAQEEARKQGVAHGIRQVLVQDDEATGELKLTTIVYQKASPQIIELMENPQHLLTGLTWTGLAMAERIAMLKQLAMPADLTFAENILDVLPQKSKDYILGWQKQINNGGAWTGSQSVGNTAERLIEAGYVLVGEYHLRDSRTGLPGSPGFVQAIMGEAYLTWLVANEEHPIEV